MNAFALICGFFFYLFDFKRCFVGIAQSQPSFFFAGFAPWRDYYYSLLPDHTHSIR
jgi:hypothetical protein